jgi:hypothetical protein
LNPADGSMIRVENAELNPRALRGRNKSSQSALILAPFNPGLSPVASGQNRVLNPR